MIKPPPLPASPAEALRVQHSRLRRRVVYGQHEEDVRDRLTQAIGTDRARATRIVDMTSNPAWYVCSQLSALYREIPEVAPPDGLEDAAAAIAEAGYWQLAQRVQRDTIAFNDLFVRVDIDDDGAPSFRLVPPDLCEPIFRPLAPSQPVGFAEWLPDPDNRDEWVRLECYPGTRVYRAIDGDGKDVTDRVVGQANLSGDAYPFLIGETPVLPYVAYHAAQSGYGLDPYTGREVFEGALQLGVYYSFFGHALRQASWAQRWAAGLRPAGATTSTDGRRDEVVADPASLLLFDAAEEAGGQAQVGQFTAPVDVDRLFAAIERYERRMVEMALSTVGVSRRESDVRSAMSLAVSREAQREAQRAYEPVFRRSDIRLCRLVAGLRGDVAPAGEDWRINYKSIPKDSAELGAELDQIEKKLAQGLIDKVDAYRELHPGMTRAEAEAALVAIAETNTRLAATAEPLAG